MGMSDKIEAFILELMRQEEEEWLKLQRNELAQIFGCVPSQINYVIATRFNSDRGYIVRSRRGGGGCVQIRRVEHETIGEGISEKESRQIVSYLYTKGKITAHEADIINLLLSEDSLLKAQKPDLVRADSLNALLGMINDRRI